MTPPIALQLFTTRDEMDADVENAIERVMDIGYRHVEVGALHGSTPQLLLACYDRLGLSIVSLHADYDTLEEDLPGQLEAARTLGCRYVTCTSITPRLRNPKGYREAVALLSQCGARAADEGVTICYHNHSFEFERLDDSTRGMDIMYADDQPPTYQAQLDVYWVAHGGDDPISWMRRLRGRLDLLHMKDMAPGRRFTEVGCGTLDIAAIVTEADRTQVRVLIIEQDTDLGRIAAGIRPPQL